MVAGQATTTRRSRRYEAILVKTPALTMINGQIGRVQRMKKDYDGAIASYQKVLAADPNNDKAKIEVGMTYLEKGDFAGAEKALMPKWRLR